MQLQGNNVFRGVLLVILTVATAVGEDGLCGLEKPERGESCTGKTVENDKAEQLVNVTEIWTKRLYKKIKYTNLYDWPLREELDSIDEILSQKPEEAVFAIGKFLQRHPKSPRGNLMLAFAKELLLKKKETKNLDEAKDEADFEEVWKMESNQVLDMVEGLTKLISMHRDVEVDGNEDDDEFFTMNYDVPPMVFATAVNMALKSCDSYNLTEKAVDVLEMALSTNEKFSSAEERYHLVLIQEYLLELLNGSKDVSKKLFLAIGRGQKLFPLNLQLRFYSGLAERMMGNKKEGNIILRAINSETGHSTEFANDLSMLGTSFLNRGRPDVAKILFQEASKLHIFPSSVQTPIMSHTDLESQTIWPLNEEEIDVALTKHDEEFKELEAHFEAIKGEATELMENGSDDNKPWLQLGRKFADYSLVKSYPGKMKAYPLFMWGKRKLLGCSVAKQTCNLIQKHFEAARCKVCTSKFLLFEPQFEMLPHSGPTNTRLRAYLPLKNSAQFQMQIGKNQLVDFEDGKLTVVDESFQHTFKNPSKEPVAMLAIDFEHPKLPQSIEGMSLTTYGKSNYEVY